MAWVRRLAGGVALGVVVIGAAGWWWIGSATDAQLARTFEVHAGDFPIPPPPALEEAGGDALERSIARGEHLVRARYVCVECHGQDFGGGVMIDDPVVGTVRGPNLTTGAGSVTRDYTAADWDRKVRHGVDPRGHSGFMPSEDYVDMSDQELGDVVAYIRSLPPVDRPSEALRTGPLGRLLVATGQLPLAADRIRQRTEHEALPPAPEVSLAFGQHVTGVCTGCHRANFEGGPIPGGAPDWKPAANLSPGPDGLASWTYEQFERVMRTGLRPDGTPVGVPMAKMVPYGMAWTDTEIRAAWMYLRSVPAVADGT